MKKIAAFFDVDGTIFRNSLLIEHFKMLIRFEFIDEGSFFGEIKHKFKMWEERKGSYDDYLEELVDIYMECIKNVDKKDIEYVAQRVIENRAQKLYAYSRNKIKEHLEKGHLVIIISGSPSFLVDKMAKKLNATDFIATEYLLDENNKYNGKNIPMWDSKSKINAIKNFEKKYNIDLENSYAYGDTTGDFGMFEMVGNPVAINPAKRLFKKILDDKNIKDKIKIVVERKDMVYILNSDVEFM
ncbi:HAD family hydrolase [Streptobacillus ratti]|uniref:HAD family hydrolase n=1 Tax=Streptobacillus ratti TaxID=1720557 RepID=UPI000932545C|nr:HAD-IB family hydrolase [Streptobacillus ratti]